MADHKEELTQIIADCKRGDKAAFETLVDLYAKRCFGYFYRMTGNVDVSNDLLGELFLKLVSKMGYYDGGSFDSWLFKIAANLYFDHLRSLKREKKLIESHKENILEEAGSPDFDGETIEKLQKQLDRLDQNTRELIMLRFYSQLSFKEIAETRREPIGTILSKVHRGLAKLRESMEKNYEQAK